MAARPSPDVLADRLAARRYGVLTRANAAAAGLTVDQMRQRVRSGRWLRISPGVFRVAGAPATPERTALEAVLSAGESAVASHLTALALVGVGTAPATPHVTVPRSTSARATKAVVHRSTIDPVDRTSVGPIPCSSPARSLLDVASTLPQDLLAGLVDEVLCAGLAQPAAIVGAVRRSQRAPGRKGVPLLFDALGPWIDAIQPGSPAEVRLLRRLESWGLPTPHKQHRVLNDLGDLVAALDLAWPELLVGLEYDGALHHTPRHLAHDVPREERLRALGWRIERVDRFDLRPSATRLRDLLVPLFVRSAA